MKSRTDSAVPRLSRAVLIAGIFSALIAAGACLPGAALAGPNSWTLSPNPPRGIMCQQVHSYGSGHVIMAGTNQGVYETADGAASWHSVGTGLVDGARITWDAIACKDGTRVAACSDGVYSIKPGQSAWTLISGSDNARSLRKLAENNGALVGVGDNGVFLSADHGVNWVPAAAGPKVRLYQLMSIGTTLVAGSYITTGGAYLSSDGGSTWTTATGGIPANVKVGRIATTTAGLWVTADDALYFSADFGSTWTSPRAGNFYGLAERPGGGVVVSDFTGHLWETPSPTGNGAWTSHDGLVDRGVQELFTVGTKVFVVYRNIGVFSQTVPAWGVAQAANAGLPVLAIYSTWVSKSGVYLCGARLDNSGTGLYRSTDQGKTWSLVPCQGLASHYVFGFDENAAGRVIALSDTAVFESTDTVNWTRQGAPGQPGACIAYGLDDTTTIIGDYGNRVFTWKEGDVAASQLPTTGLPIDGTYAVAQAADGSYLCSKNAGTFRLAPAAVAWTSVGGALFSPGIVRTADGTLCAAESLNGLAVSHDNGLTWVDCPGGAKAIARGIWKRPSDEALFYSGMNGVWRTKDRGATWITIGGPTPQQVYGISGTFDGSAMVMGSDTGPLLYSAPDVHRMTGKNRYDVTEGIARSGWDPAGDLSWPHVTDIVIASGDDAAMADPLAAAGLAGLWDAPVLTVSKTAVPAQTSRVITEIAAANHGVKIHIVGGTGSVPDARWTTIKSIAHVSSAYDRIAGADRYVVTANIANRMISVLAARGATVPGVLLVCSEKPAAFYDALAVGPVAYAQHMPMLGVRTTAVSKQVRAVLTPLVVAGKPVYSASGAGYISAPIVATTGATRLTTSSFPSTASVDVALAATSPSNNWLGVGEVGVAAKLSDALTGGAFMGHMGGPLMFTNSSSKLMPAPAGFLAANAGSINEGWVFGGDVSVPPGQQTKFKQLIQIP